jgi:hypothetical protein
MEKIYRLVNDVGGLIKLYTTKSRAKAAKTYHPRSRMQETQVAWRDLEPVNNAGTNP